MSKHYKIFLLIVVVTFTFSYPLHSSVYALTRGDVLSGVDAGSAASDMDSASVDTDEDLQAYARATLRSNENLEVLNFTENAVEVRYKERGKFLALMPVTFSINARAKADGTVELEYPWYSFLTIDNRDRIETDMKVAVGNALRSRLVGSVQAVKEEGTPLSAVESATMAAEMERVLKESFMGTNLWTDGG